MRGDGGGVYWRARIASAVSVEELEKIDHELAALDPELRRWRMAVATRKLAFKDRAPPINSSNLTPMTASPTPSLAFASAYGLPAPDGRRLHAYRLEASRFLALHGDLAKHQSYSELNNGYVPGLFVLWASEWFRRSYNGGVRCWESLTDALGMPKPGQAEQLLLRDITRSGLKTWKRQIYTDTNNQYLATLAREGGFPAYAVAGGAQSWAKTVLGAIVQRLMGAPSAGAVEALGLANDQSGNLPGVFKDQEFIQLCADLAMAIVKVRRDYEDAANAAGLPLASWLKLKQPDWQDGLPISTGEAEADKLIESLIQVEAIKGSIVSVERFLKRYPSSDRWQEAVRLDLDGEIAATNMGAVDTSHGRLRVFAAGAMARYVPGELGLFDPPGIGASTWSARSSRDTRSTRPLPFSCPVQIDLRAGGRLIAQVDLPGGKPRRGQLLVCVLEEGTLDAPTALRVIGSGSGSYRQPEVFLQAPNNWAVVATDEGSSTDMGAGIGATKIWKISGGARLIDPTNDTYKVLCGQSKDRSGRIELIGHNPHWAALQGDIDLFVGAPHISKTGQGDLLIRQLGSMLWRPTPSSLPIGHYELALREDGIMVDRRRIAVLPLGATIKTVFRNNSAEFELSGFDIVTVTPAEDAPVQHSSQGDRWFAKPSAKMAHCFTATIRWLSAPPLVVTIDYPGEASIATWDGRILPHRQVLTIDDLQELVAVDGSNMVLLGHLRDPTRKTRSEMAWSFWRELPMSAIASDIASMLLPASIDAEVVLDMNNGINTTWHVRHFPMRLIKEGAGFVSDQAIVDDDVHLCGRALHDPANERAFGPYSLLSDDNHRPISRPNDLEGDWLVYLRRGPRVLTRPQYVRATSCAVAPIGALATAMAAPFGNALDGALTDFLTLAGGDDPPSIAALNELLALVESLRGLPPSTFAVLTRSADFPAVLTRMVYFAQSAQREGVIGLSLALPFAWFAIEKRHWVAAEQALGRASMELFAGLGADAPRFALQRIEMVKKAIMERLPILAPVLGSYEAVTIDQAAQAFMRHAVQQIQPSDGTRYRARLGNALPAYFHRFSQEYFDTLDAPCAAALAVKGTWRPEVDDIHHMKLIARTFPTWFAEAFALSL